MKNVKYVIKTLMFLQTNFIVLGINNTYANFVFKMTITILITLII